MTVLTILILIYWTISLYRSYRRGFVRTIVSILLFFVFIAAVRGLAPSLKASLQKQPAVASWAEEVCRDFAEGRLEAVADGEAADSLWLSILPVPEEIRTMAGSGVSGPLRDILLSETVTTAVGKALSPVFLGITALLAAALVSLLVLGIIGHIINKAACQRGFGGVNHFLGLIFGLTKVLVLTWLVMALITAAADAGLAAGLGEQISGSAFLTALNAVNPFSGITGA